MTALEEREAAGEAGVVKVTVVEVQKALGDGKSNALPDQFREQGLYNEGGVVEPLYNPAELVQIVQQSSILPQCIAAMVQNVHGFGFTLTAHPSLKPGEGGKWPAAVQAEKDRLDFFFAYGHPTEKWDATRKKLWWDVEAAGNGYLELLRDGKGDLCGWEKLDPTEIRMTGVDRELTEFKVKARVGTEYKELTFRKRFRRYVQLSGGRPAVWFREYGDPRVDISSATGKPLAAKEIEANVPSATEILHFGIYAPGTPYGVPRWVGNMPAVAGARAADEVNWSFFDNKATPPYFIMVSGGALSDGSIKRITDAVKGAKGRDKFHSAVILETAAAPLASAPGAKPSSITVQPMTVQQDGLFQEYDHNSRAKVRSSFRLPPLFAGESEDYSHATAQASQEVAESQVFAPEREAFDDLVNRTVLADLGARFWTFQTNSGKETDPQQLTDIITKIAAEGGLTAGEVRMLAEEILGREFEELPKEADWLTMPLKVWLQKAGAEAQQQAAEAGVEKAPADKTPVKKGDAVASLVKLLLDVRKGMLEAEANGDAA